MQTTSLTFGIVSIIGFSIAFIPCLGWLYWFILPISLIGLIISIVETANQDGSSKAMPITGICLCGVTLIFGGIRWILGGFIL